MLWQNDVVVIYVLLLLGQENLGRRFFGCRGPRGRVYTSFTWNDDKVNERDKNIFNALLKKNDALQLCVI